MLPNAVTKSLHANSRCSLPFTRLQPFVLASSAVISASESFFAGMAHSSGIGWRSLQPLCGASAAPATFPVSLARAADCVNALNGSSLNARGNSIIVGSSFEAKMRVVRACQRKAENDVKKKIRAIQYGVGPIGASIARLMREKQAIEIIGAIDRDPAKIGRDLGEVVGAADAPWGVKISAEAKEVLEKAADVVIHSTSSSLAKVMDQLLMCLEAESCIVSTCEELSYPFRTHAELAAAEKSRRGNDRRGISRAGCSGGDQARRLAGIGGHGGGQFEFAGRTNHRNDRAESCHRARADRVFGGRAGTGGWCAPDCARPLERRQRTCVPRAADVRRRERSCRHDMADRTSEHQLDDSWRFTWRHRYGVSGGEFDSSDPGRFRWPAHFARFADWFFLS